MFKSYSSIIGVPASTINFYGPSPSTPVATPEKTGVSEEATPSFLSFFTKKTGKTNIHKRKTPTKHSPSRVSKRENSVPDKRTAIDNTGTPMIKDTPKPKSPHKGKKADERTIEMSKETRQSDQNAIWKAKKDKKRADRRAKAAAAVDARAEAKRFLKLAEEAQAKGGQGKKDDDDDKSFDSNISYDFENSNENPSVSIEGEDPAPDNVKEMLKNAVKGNVDPRAWTMGWGEP